MTRPWLIHFNKDSELPRLTSSVACSSQVSPLNHMGPGAASVLQYRGEMWVAVGLGISRGPAETATRYFHVDVSEWSCGSCSGIHS